MLSLYSTLLRVLRTNKTLKINKISNQLKMKTMEALSRGTKTKAVTTTSNQFRPNNSSKIQIKMMQMIQVILE